MKTAAVVLTAVLAAAATSGPVVSRAAVAAVEKSFDQKVEREVLDSPYLLLGMARGVYLPGYGAVFTMEMNLAHGGSVGPFGAPPKEQLERVHKKKTEVYPRLKKAMREMLVSAAGSLDTVPPQEKIVLGVSLLFHSSEIRNGLPQQVVMAAGRKALLEFQTNPRPPAPLESVIEVQEIKY